MTAMNPKVAIDRVEAEENFFLFDTTGQTYVPIYEPLTREPRMRIPAFSEIGIHAQCL